MLQNNRMSQRVITLALNPESIPTKPGWQGIARILVDLGAVVRRENLSPGTVGGLRHLVGSGSVTVVVDSKLHRERGIFTVAHEIAHLLLNRSTVVFELFKELPRDPASTERLCDSIAGSLLMPDSWISQIGKPATLASLRYHAKSADATPSALATRWAATGHACLYGGVETTSSEWKFAYRGGGLSSVSRSTIIDSVRETPVGSSARFPILTPSRNQEKSALVIEIARRNPSYAEVWIAGCDPSPRPGSHLPIESKGASHVRPTAAVCAEKPSAHRQ